MFHVFSRSESNARLIWTAMKGEYKISKRWSASAASVTRDENGGFAVDGKYHKRY